MVSKLKEIYQDKFIEDVTSLNSNYYYFYHPTSSKLFGISKTISKQEYELLKLQYVEKVIYIYDEKLNKVYAYLLEQGSYPFPNKMKLIIYKVNKEDEGIVTDLLSKIYPNCATVCLFDYCICFYQEKYDQKVQELFETITTDLGYNVPLHEGIMIQKNVPGVDVFMYIEAFCKNNVLNHYAYSDVSEMILEMDKNNSSKLLQFLIQLIYLPTFKEQNKDILEVMIKNDLNVSSSAKYLYMNRNSLINKLDVIYKETGFNLQKFKHACAIYLLSKLSM